MPRNRYRTRRVVTAIIPPQRQPPEARNNNNNNTEPLPPLPNDNDATQEAMRRSFMMDGVNPNRATAHYERTVNQYNHENHPKSVQNVYDGKKMEYMQFCEKVYPRDPYKYTINNRKAYNFLFYQVMRKKKSVGGRKDEDFLTGQKIYFDYDDYCRVKRLHDNHDPLSGHPPPEPTNPLGYSQIEHYRHQKDSPRSAKYGQQFKSIGAGMDGQHG